MSQGKEKAFGFMRRERSNTGGWVRAGFLLRSLPFGAVKGSF